VLLGFLAWLAGPLAAQAKERIVSFDSTITVARDGTLEVRELIRVKAEGENIRRGIYRDFPTVYQAKDGRTITVGFVFERATRDGNDEPWRIEAHDNGQRIWLGSKSVELSHGEHTYELVYRTDRQMGYFADHDELYWNVTGNGWGFEIERATATIRLPDNIPRNEVTLEAYTGEFGDKGQEYRAEIRGDDAFFTTTQSLDDHEGLTIVASWPKGYILPGVEYPQAMSGPTQSPGYDFARDAGRGTPVQPGWSPLEAFLEHRVTHDNGAFWYTLLGFAVLMGYYLVIWNRVGRDPPGRVIIPEYQPPTDQSPASMRYITQMSYDDACFGAAVLSLAVKGYLRIQQDSGVLGFGKTFTLIKQDAAGKQPLTADEHVLLRGLFSEVDALELKSENHSIVGGARRVHYACLKNLYSSGFFRINGGWHFLGIVISLVVLVVAIILPGAGEEWPWWHVTTPLGWATGVMALGGIVSNGVFGRLLKAPTPRGQAAMDHIRGFKMYLEVAEGEELKRVTAPPPMTPQLFESYLPAALALGVDQKWAERFAEVLNVQAPNYQPAWYSGPGFDSRQLGAFSSQLGSSLNSAISSSSTAPGSSSGSGGGGSSGGGGGGGGGGGW
jgi:uncharacterized membrane protein YgcG